MQSLAAINCPNYNRSLGFTMEEDSQELKAILTSIQQCCETELELDELKSPKAVLSNFNKLAALGLTQMNTPADKGGIGSSYSEIAACVFELAKYDIGPAIFLPVHLMVCGLIAKWDLSKQHSETLDALTTGKALGAFCLTEASSGSDAGSLKLEAKKTSAGYILSGEKIYITNAIDAGFYLVFAKTNQISAFVIPSDLPGISVGPAEKKSGASGAPIASINFDQCEIPRKCLLGNEDEGFKIALSGLAGGRINIAAAACGISYHALSIARRHLLERKQFGTLLKDFQGLQFMYADMAGRHMAAVSLVRRAAIELQRNPRSDIEVSAAKYFSTDMCMQNTVDAIQLLGGAGYLQDYGVEKLMRDAKMLQIVEGTNQIQRIIIGKGLLSG